MVVFVFEAISIKGVILHSDIVESTNGFKVFSFSKFFKLRLCLVEVEHISNAVEMLTDIVLVLEDSERSVDLIFVHLYLIIINDIIL